MVNQHKNIGIIPPKDIDSLNRSLFIKTFFWVFIPLCFIGYFYFGSIKGLLISFGSSLVITAFIVFIAEKFSNVAKILYGGRSAILSDSEQLQSLLSTARLAKMNNNYSKAMAIIDDILEQNPEFYEGMLVKAQILHEGFNKTDKAKKYLIKVIDNTEPDDNVHIWSATLYEQLKNN
jgi:tetratricopeptide (TPR) repeat protein